MYARSRPDICEVYSCDFSFKREREREKDTYRDRECVRSLCVCLCVCVIEREESNIGLLVMPSSYKIRTYV